MRAARFRRFGGPEVLEIVDLPDPRPGAGEIRIAVRAAGISASDWKKRQGLMDRELPQTLGYDESARQRPPAWISPSTSRAAESFPRSWNSPAPPNG